MTRGILFPFYQRLTLRHFQTFAPKLNAAKKVSGLGALRKKTGYSLSLCKQALAENDQNVERAEIWLQEQAQAQGWSKAQKLEGRNTMQGLVGLFIDNNVAAMVELNCETDFVAKNSKFHSLLNEIVNTKFQLAKSRAATSEDISVQHWDKDQLGELKTESGKLLNDLVALYIGQIGENIVLRRGVTLTCKKDGYFLTGVTHPSGSATGPNRISYGRYGTVLAYTKDPHSGSLPEGQTVASMARQLCQHVIGMNPSTVGNFDDKSTWPSLSTTTTDSIEQGNSRGEGEKEDEDISLFEKETQVHNKDVDVMIHQSFLMNPDVLVRDVLAETGLRVHSFTRFEVGQS